jgi:predicted RNA-binding Zn-ribbon protein involved in translation (DUF1610 family)
MELIRILGRINKDNSYHYSEFKCPVCGKSVIRHTSNGRRSKTCGCLGLSYNNNNNFKHGETKTRLYTTWQNMKKRCYNKSHISYPWYGAKNIRVCDDWHDYREFKRWAIVDDGYCSENCAWQTKSENATESNNRRGDKVKEKKARGA